MTKRKPVSLVAATLLVGAIWLAMSGGGGTVPTQAQGIPAGVTGSPGAGGSPGPEGSPVPPPIVAEPPDLALPAPRGSGPIFHIMARRIDRNVLGFATNSAYAEYWIDERSGDMRRVERDDEGTVRKVEVRVGLRYTLLDHKHKHALTRVAAHPDAPTQRMIVNWPIGWREQTLSGRLGPARETAVAGRRVLTARTTADRPPPEAPDIEAVDTRIDAETGLMLGITAHRRVAGVLVATEVSAFSYSVVESMEPAEAPTDLFGADVPSDWARETYTEYTPETAYQYTEFTAYWIGPRFDGIPLAGMDHKESIPRTSDTGHGRLYDRLSDFGVSYRLPPSDPEGVARELAVMTQPPADPRMEAARERAVKTGLSSSGEAVTVGGRSGRLFVPTYGGRVRLEIDLGDVRVAIYGENRDQVLRAGEVLKKLN